MAAASNLVNVLEDARKRIDLFQSFWDRRISIESNHLRELEGLVFDVPEPAGTLKDALDALNALLRIEIAQKTDILGKLRDLRGGYTPFGGWGTTSRAYWLSSVAGYFDKGIAELAKHKSDLATREGLAEMAALGAETEAVAQPAIKRWLPGKLKIQPSPNSLKTPAKVPPCFDRFRRCDQRLRSLLGHYNDSREQYIAEFKQVAAKLVTDESKAIAMIQQMISAFADSQSDLASALNSGSLQCRFMANKISPSTEGHDSLIRIQTSISAALGRPHQYKNFWFGVGDLRSPTMLFGYMPNSNSEATALKCTMRLLEVFVKHDPVLSLGPSDNGIDLRSEQLSKLAHDLEMCWDPDEVDGGGEVVRLLTTDTRYQGLVLHFLSRTPRPIVDVPKLDFPTTISDVFGLFCEKFNKSRSYSERKILSVVLRLLVDSSTDEGGVQWIWWDQHKRKRCWYIALTWQNEEMMPELFPLLIHCIELKAGKFVFRQEMLEGLYKSWKQSVNSKLIPPNIFPM